MNQHSDVNIYFNGTQPLLAVYNLITMEFLYLTLFDNLSSTCKLVTEVETNQSDAHYKNFDSKWLLAFVSYR